MSIPYLEIYLVDGIKLGIEDLKDGQPDHFMPERQKQRFHLWVSGCGFGSADTLADARQQTYDYIVQMLDASIEKHQAILNAKETARRKLDTNDPARLMQFLQDTPEGK